MTRRRKSTILDWVACLGLPIFTIIVCDAVDLAPLWMDALVYTVVLFAGILTAPWRKREFWQSLAVVFAAHAVVVVWAILVLQEFPERRRFGIPKLMLFPIASIEGTFIAGALWKTITRLKNLGSFLEKRAGS